MTKWDRVRGVHPRYCGGPCGRQLDVGTPVFVYVLGAGRERIRCEACARQKAPPDLPRLEDAPPAPPPLRYPLVSFSAGMLPLDWRPTVEPLREREPGEEG